MARLTITLSDERHQQLKIRAARQGTTIGAIIEKELALLEESNRHRAMELTRKARENAAKSLAGMTDEDIERWVVAQVQASRVEKRAHNAS